MTRNNRLFAIGSVTLMIALVVAGWFLAAQPFIDAAAAADTERAAVDSQNQTHQAQISQLVNEKKQLPALKSQLLALNSSIPSSSDTSGFITALNALAVSTGVQITGITIGDPQAYTVPVSASKAAPTSTSTPTPAPTATAAPAPVAAAPAAPSAVTNPLITPANFVGILVGVDVAGPNEAVLAFTKGLQSGSRLFLVTGYASNRVVDNPDPSAVTAHVSGYIYVIKSAG